jgi:hypothetical protein
VLKAQVYVLGVEGSGIGPNCWKAQVQVLKIGEGRKHLFYQSNDSTLSNRKLFTLYTTCRCMEVTSGQGLTQLDGSRGHILPSPRISPITISGRPEFVSDSDSDAHQGISFDLYRTACVLSYNGIHVTNSSFKLLEQLTGSRFSPIRKVSHCMYT